MKRLNALFLTNFIHLWYHSVTYLYLFRRHFSDFFTLALHGFELLKEGYGLRRREGEVNIIMMLNPYTPGAGKTPAYLAGRDKIIEKAREAIIYLQNGYTGQSKIYYGLRGVGKTVLLNTIEDIAETLDILYEHIEISESIDFKKVISLHIKKFMSKLSQFDSFSKYGRKAIGILKAFCDTWSPESRDLNFGICGDVEMAIGTADTGNFQNDLTELFVAVGTLAKKSGKCICIFLDEMQYLKDDEFEGLIAAIHRVNQKDLPIMLFGAGLPKIAKLAGEIKSFAERLFDFIPVVSLDKQEAADALVEPAKNKGVIFDEAAVNDIFILTGGYPYFIQEYGKQVWQYVENDFINEEAIKKAFPIFQQSLCDSFFRVRFERATPKDKEFMYAMASCGTLPCTLAQVAKNMKSSIRTIAPIRANLIYKGFIYPTGHGEIDFTVPQFDSFLKRMEGLLRNPAACS